MIKKFLIGISLFSILPLIALAQFPRAEMSDCCELRHDITVSRLSTSVIAACVDVPNSQYQIGCVISGNVLGSSCSSRDQTLTVEASDPDWGGVCTMDTVYTATDFLFWAFFAISVTIGVWAGFTFITAGGNPGKIEKAKGLVTYLVIGIVVGVAVRLIPALARSIVGV